MNDLNQTVDEPGRDQDVPVAAESTPTHIGRYRVEKLLGNGGFGLVYLAHDDQLRRLVAIKVPHAKLVSRPEDADAYLTEARTVANLDHPNIVPVHDVGSTEHFPCFIVSKYIDGTDLATRLRESRLSINEAIEVVATVAEALHHAHKQGLVHRDIKPGNILLDKSGKPFVGDFGLALREQDIGKRGRYAGTPAYMSPEQARGEGHRVDGRSDVFSLGVVLYELLGGRQPFRADSQTELMEQVTSHEPRPLRQMDESIPKELERICFKALCKRASERYMTARDMAEDLRYFLVEQTINQQSGTDARGFSRSTTAVSQPPSTSISASRAGLTSATTPTSDSQPVKIIPKGLRSFDEHDADFFLELLPGPRDRDGLPDGIRFWKTRIEETDADKTFSVGLIYGPSGCGKSSLVKAGLLPRLSQDVIAVYVEATAGETETRLLGGLRKRCPALPANLGLKDTLAALRRGQGIAVGKKVLIVLDQFEQWLHAKKDEENTELVQALRHCDGGRVQCIVMVRDDFWMAATRFMRELEVRLVEGQNSASVDLFPPPHAEKVLAAFGRAFAVLPEKANDTTKEQKEFVKQVVLGLAQEGKVISIRLALFAEMVKGKPWLPVTLKKVGGTEGVGVTFLEETFSAATAPPEHRYHQKAARAVLKALLPESGSDIKGSMRSQQDLLAASGYTSRPRDFGDLLRILDAEIRLITPTDPEGTDDTDPSTVQAGAKYYQLTHDYLVHSLRDWLTRKQKETRTGRAELMLADRAAVWNARPESRQLPSLLQWLQIRWHTRQKNWTPPRRKMMRKASRYHAVRTGLVAVLFAVATVKGLTIRDQVEEQRMATYADGLVQSLLNANIAQVPAIVSEMAGYRKWTDPRLREEKDRAAVKSPQKLNTSLALLPVDATQVEYLYRRLLDAESPEVPVIRDALAAHKDELVNRLWEVVEKPENGIGQQRLCAACALASYDLPDNAPGEARWQRASTTIVDELLAAVQKNPSHYAALLEQLRPVRASLLPPLGKVYRSKEKSEAERSFATIILADYAADKPDVLANLLMDADDRQFAVIYPKLKDQSEKGLPVLLWVIDTKLPAAFPCSNESQEKLAKQQANAAVAMLMLNHSENVWPLLKHSPDPRVRSYLIHRFGPLGAGSGQIIKRLDDEPDMTIRRALMLSLGEFGEKELPADARSSLLSKLKEIYGTETDPGLHASAEWLLRHWKQDGWLKQVNKKWAKDTQGRVKRIEGIQRLVKKGHEKTPPQWYVNGQGQTMVVIAGPVEFVMGSPPTEAGRESRENQHKMRIGRTFALAAKSVTLAEYQRFAAGYGGETLQWSPTGDCPVLGISWFQAAAYCNWLSKEEGLPESEWCYEPLRDAKALPVLAASSVGLLGSPLGPVLAVCGLYPGRTDPEYKVGMKLAANYLKRSGYRLPTEAEMEFATRAGSVTSRYYGETEELLPKYAWYNKNGLDRSWPVGSKKPNDFGYFDIQGNVFTWCQESFKPYPESKENETNQDKEDALIITLDNRGLRGGSFGVQASVVRSAFRQGVVPTYRSDGDVGLRPARTFAP